MAFFYKLLLSVTILLAANAGSATDSGAEMEEAVKIYHEMNKQNDPRAQPFMQLISQFAKSTLAVGRCTGSWDCEWPATQCKNNRCVKPNGDGAQCSGSWDCEWPASQCRNGLCVKPNGDGGECTGGWDCEWPYSRCKKGFCERP